MQFAGVMWNVKESDAVGEGVSSTLGCLTSLMLAGVLARLVNEKLAEAAPVALDTTLYGPPAVAFAVNVVDVATPLPFVGGAVVVAVPFANVPLAPLPGAVKVTTTPLTGLFPASVTVATIGAVNAV